MFRHVVYIYYILDIYSLLYRRYFYTQTIVYQRSHFFNPFFHFYHHHLRFYYPTRYSWRFLRVQSPLNIPGSIVVENTISEKKFHPRTNVKLFEPFIHFVQDFLGYGKKTQKFVQRFSRKCAFCSGSHNFSSTSWPNQWKFSTHFHSIFFQSW